MTYKYREVKCPWCDHVFMWSDDCREGLIIHGTCLMIDVDQLRKNKSAEKTTFEVVNNMYR